MMDADPICIRALSVATPRQHRSDKDNRVMCIHNGDVARCPAETSVVEHGDCVRRHTCVAPPSKQSSDPPAKSIKLNCSCSPSTRRLD